MMAGLVISLAFLGVAIGTAGVIIASENSRTGGSFKKIEYIHCPHHLHGRLWVYSRPIRRGFRKDVYKICAGCGRRMINGYVRPGIVGDPDRNEGGRTGAARRNRHGHQ